MPEQKAMSEQTAGADAREAIKRAVAGELDALFAKRLEAGLYLVATPIGHLGDMSLRALAVLAQADAVYCEDTRVSQMLMSRYGLRRRLRVYHEHSSAEGRAAILRTLDSGAAIALISDAGTPAISDPGFKLVRDAVDDGHRVIPIPGPAALTASVTASGLPTDQFLFAGFLPPKQAQRRKHLEELAALPFTLCFYESPHRLAACLADMAEMLGRDRPAAIGRELTKRFEEFVRGPLEDLVAWSSAAPVRGEVVIVVGPRPDTSATVTDQTISELLAAQDGTLSASRAAKRVAEELGVPKSRVYAIGLQNKRGGSCSD